MAVLFCIWGCGGGSKGSDSTSELLDAKVRIVLKRSTTETLDSMVCDISAESTTLLHQKSAGDASVLEFGGLTPGSSRKIMLRAYSGAMVVQQGEASVDLVAGETLPISITLQALVGRILMEVPLGVNNPLGVTSGSMTIVGNGASLVAVLEGSLPNRHFLLSGLQLGFDYQVKVELFGVGGVLLYKGEQTVHLDAKTPEISIPLKSLFASVNLTVTFTSTPQIAGRTVLATAKRRVPALAQELLILELLPNPKTSGSDWEYTEVYNTTQDTIVLDSCRLAKDRNTTGTTTAVKLLGCSIAPGAFAIIGRDSVAMRNCSAGEFALSNTSQSVVLHCGSLLVDSMAYSGPTDTENPFPNEVGMSLQIPAAKAANRSLGANWCAGTDSVALSGGLGVLGSPGRDAVCP